MIYEVRTLDIGSKLYRVGGYSTINMEAIIKHQIDYPPKEEEKHWAYSLYFSQNLNVCAGYIVDYNPAYLIEITLRKPMKYIFTDDPYFFTAGLSKEDSEKYMEDFVVFNTSHAIYEDTKNQDISELHYPKMPFMQELGTKKFAFSDIMVSEEKEDGEMYIQHEIIIPHSLLIGDVFTQRSIKYRMNGRMDEFEWVEE